MKLFSAIAILASLHHAQSWDEMGSKKGGKGGKGMNIKHNDHDCEPSASPSLPPVAPTPPPVIPTNPPVVDDDDAADDGGGDCTSICIELDSTYNNYCL